MGNSCSPGCHWLCLQWRLFVLFFFPLDLLDEIKDLIQSVSEGFLTYSCNENKISKMKILRSTIDLQ